MDDTRSDTHTYDSSTTGSAYTKDEELWTPYLFRMSSILILLVNYF